MVAVADVRRRRLLTAVGALLLLLTLAALPARAETTGARQADVVLLLDRSGSMAGNDPVGLTETGARVFLEMLDPADRVAIIAFDTGARTLLPLTDVGDGAAARKALDALGQPVGEWTDIKAALAAALEQVGAASAERQPAVLLFTDGKPETQPGGVPDGYRAQLMATATQLAGRSAPVFSIGLGQADFETLGQLAASTRAESFAARSSDQVVRLFSDVLSRIKERQVALSFSEELAPGAVGEPHTFVVPPYTRLLTLSGVGGTRGVTLNGQQPGGAPLENAPGLKASRGANYTVYTIPNPAPGTWTVTLAGAGRVEAHAQLDSALRLDLLEPQPYSRVPQQGTAPVEVAVAGDPDPASPLELWAQAGAGQPVKLTRSGPHYVGEMAMDDGHLAVWAVRSGQEVARREFRVYPDPTAAPRQARPLNASAGAHVAAKSGWGDLFRSAAVVATAALVLLGVGALNWRRLLRREGVLSGRLGQHSLEGRGREVRIGDLARLEARLIALGWAPLAGLYLARRQLQIYIHQAPGVRIQINEKPPGDGRLCHGDEVTLGGETLRFHNPRVARRPVAPRPPRTNYRPTFKG